MSASNTLLLGIEGPLQAWGDTSKFVIRRTMEAPTKSGIIGLLCCAAGLSRRDSEARIETLRHLKMGVRIDRPGIRWWDYHTVGAKVGLPKADGTGIKITAGTKEIETLITRREYLCDASFLVALQGEPDLIAEVEAAVNTPKWTLYLGRKCCIPSRPLLEYPASDFPDLLSALKAAPWRPRLKGDRPPQVVNCLLDWVPTPEEPEAPDDALVWYDVPLTFEPPSHYPRFVIRRSLTVGAGCDIDIDEAHSLTRTPAPPRTRTDYDKSTWGKIRDRRLADDHHLCVLCKSPAKTGQHISYRRAGKEHNLEALQDEKIMKEHLENVRSLCRLCHDAVTMIEYGLGMGLDRIDPEEPRWRDTIIRKRGEIIRFRSLETRRRHLAGEEVQ